MLLNKRPLRFREAEILYHSSLSTRPGEVRCARVGLLLDSVHDREVVGFVLLANGDGDECESAFLRSRPALVKQGMSRGNRMSSKYLLFRSANGLPSPSKSPFARPRLHFPLPEPTIHCRWTAIQPCRDYPIARFYARASRKAQKYYSLAIQHTHDALLRMGVTQDQAFDENSPQNRDWGAVVLSPWPLDQSTT